MRESNYPHQLGPSTYTLKTVDTLLMKRTLTICYYYEQFIHVPGTKAPVQDIVFVAHTLGARFLFTLTQSDFTPIF